MNLIEKWKNRESKQKLKEENIRLRTEVEMLRNIPEPKVCTVERNIQKIQSSFTVNKGHYVPTEIIKDRIAYEMAENIKSFIEYDFRDTNYGERIYSGIIYVATGDRKYEHN